MGTLERIANALEAVVQQKQDEHRIKMDEVARSRERERVGQIREAIHRKLRPKYDAIYEKTRQIREDTEAMASIERRKIDVIKNKMLIEAGLNPDEHC